MDAQLQQLIELQTKQNQLLEKYLWRLRFSLSALLILTTITCIGLGFVIYTGLTRSVFKAPPSVIYSLPARNVAPPSFPNNLPNLDANRRLPDRTGE
jgi:Na+-transporting NADH:ubiquinone oxidoreductase subunit NqrE